MTFKPTIFALFLFTTIQALGQSTVSGIVLDEKKQASPFANVLILSQKDSTMIKGVVADVDGKFQVPQIAHNTYLLAITTIGYQKHYQKIEVRADLNLGNIQLLPESKTLSEVEVSVKKQLIERSGDKMIMNVEASPITSGLNGLELMEKVPGVTVDRNSETIKVKGKSGVLVMIDDRKTYLSDEQLANFLKTLKSDDIDKIEVITNPSARYDASGTTAIINIKTKKGKNFGTNYIVDMGVGYSNYKEYGSFPKNNQGITMNAKKGKYTLYANISRNYMTWFNISKETQELYEGSNLVETRNNIGNQHGDGNSWSSKVAFDYDFTKKTSIGFTVQGALSDNALERSISQRNQKIGTFQQIEMLRNRDSNNKNYLFNTHLKQTFDTSGTVLNVDFDVILNKSNINDRFTTTTLSEGNNSLVKNQIITPNDFTTYALKADFVKNLTKKVKLETGFKSSFSDNAKDFNDNFRDNGALVNSYFKFKQNIHAAYFMLNTELSKTLNLQTGLRGEQTYTSGTDRAGEELSTQNYFNLFPTFSLNKKVTKDYAVSLDFSRRINRPNSDNFNTFNRFFSPQQYAKGNPNLLPSLNNSISMTHTIKDAFSFSVDYVTVKQFFADVYSVDSVYIPGNRLIKESVENVNGKVSWWSFSTSLPFNLTKWWNVNVNIWSGINIYNYSRENAVVDVNQFYSGLYLQQTFTLNKTLSAEISGYVNSGETWGFETSKAQGAFDLGIKKFLWDKKGTLKISIEDPADLNRFRNVARTNELISTGEYRWDNRRLRINFTYNFGNTNVKVNQRPSDNDGGGGGKGKG
ncbi:outer membrane beta-barrel protein [Arcicella rosea]|uniref:Outer membrane protein beta-barrel domain-containing protein n=1 Tax=Arcicella rosea TaxID=502909 RepID=A0A841EFF2_9BACT|nr:outer membrane beta-barrel protein [Arcicella rosea]MBB6001726.1 hypothetical protein [Arcicella rosea]